MITALIIGAVIGMLVHALEIIPTLLVIIVYLLLIGFFAYGVTQLIMHPGFLKTHGTTILVGSVVAIVVSLILPKK